MNGANICTPVHIGSGKNLCNRECNNEGHTICCCLCQLEWGDKDECPDYKCILRDDTVVCSEMVALEAADDKNYGADGPPEELEKQEVDEEVIFIGDEELW